MTVKQLVSGLVALGAAVGALGTIAGQAKAYLDRHYVAVPVFALYTHDDTLRHQYAQRERARTQQIIDSIEKAHQHPERGRVMQAGNNR